MVPSSSGDVTRSWTAKETFRQLPDKKWQETFNMFSTLPAVFLRRACARLAVLSFTVHSVFTELKKSKRQRVQCLWTRAS